MKIIEYPDKKLWPGLLRRPLIDMAEIRKIVQSILDDIKNEGDEAVLRCTKIFDGELKGPVQVEVDDILDSQNQLSEPLKDAIHIASGNIKKFHQAQRRNAQKIETWPGVTCWRKSTPIEKVGLYIPIAGCSEIILCTPPGKNGKIHPAILYAAEVVGLKKIFKIGGAQAIAAMAYGTETIPKVYKIFGPGNQYVTAAKQLITLDGVGIDLPAGPSEVAVLADDSAEPDFIALDLLSQAEHGPDSQVILVSDSKNLIDSVQKSINNRLAALPRKEIAEKSLQKSTAFLVKNLRTGMDLINAYAPEHLIINIRESEKMVGKVKNAGSVFVGPYTPESAGDYASGTNHTLPTNGYAMNYSGVSLESFMKQITFQQISPEGLKEIGWAIGEMAVAETLYAHKEAVSVRLAAIGGEYGNG